MGKSYSLDLRERVVSYVNKGHSRREAASVFDVSPSFAVKVASRHGRTGSVAPARQGRPRGSGKLSPHLSALIAWVEERPDITMAELAALLAAEREVVAHPASLSRALRRAGLSYKKNAAGLGVRTPRRQAEAADQCLQAAARAQSGASRPSGQTCRDYGRDCVS